jgi:hypothetical protein
MKPEDVDALTDAQAEQAWALMQRKRRIAEMRAELKQVKE